MPDRNKKTRHSRRTLADRLSEKYYEVTQPKSSRPDYGGPRSPEVERHVQNLQTAEKYLKAENRTIDRQLSDPNFGWRTRQILKQRQMSNESRLENYDRSLEWWEYPTGTDSDVSGVHLNDPDERALGEDAARVLRQSRSRRQETYSDKDFLQSGGYVTEARKGR